MRKENFKSILIRKNYLYREEGDKIIVIGRTHLPITDINLGQIKNIPPNVIFSESIHTVKLNSLINIPIGIEFHNSAAVLLSSLEKISPGTKFLNGGNVNLENINSIPSGIEFKNSGDVNLENLKNLSPEVIFQNKKDLYLTRLEYLPKNIIFGNTGFTRLSSLKSIPPGTVFNGKVSLRSLFKKGWFDSWEGNIENINSTDLLNKMISEGLLDKKN